MMTGTWFHRTIAFVGPVLLVVGLAACGNRPGQSGDTQTGDDVIIPQEKIVLWNGKDFSNWVFQLKDPQVDPGQVWSIQDGAIHCAGNPYGYMRTTKSYANYALHVEWRWPEGPGNSGVFVHMQEPDKVWPTLLECQLQSGHAGDFVAFTGIAFNELEGPDARVVAKKADSSERPAGEWNAYDIQCQENTVKVFVNGVFQNEATGLNYSSGKICLQSEGKPVEFRNVYVEPL